MMVDSIWEEPTFPIHVVCFISFSLPWLLECGLAVFSNWRIFPVDCSKTTKVELMSSLLEHFSEGLLRGSAFAMVVVCKNLMPFRSVDSVKENSPLAIGKAIPRESKATLLKVWILENLQVVCGAELRMHVPRR